MLPVRVLTSRFVTSASSSSSVHFKASTSTWAAKKTRQFSFSSIVKSIFNTPENTQSSHHATPAAAVSTPTPVTAAAAAATTPTAPAAESTTNPATATPSSSSSSSPASSVDSPPAATSEASPAAPAAAPATASTATKAEANKNSTNKKVFKPKATTVKASQMSSLPIFSDESLRRTPSPIRALQPLMSTPGMINFGGGLPNPSLFPFSALSFTVKDPETGAATQTIELTPEEMKEALQYSATPGLPRFIAQLISLQQREHKPQYAADDWSVSVTTGSQDGIWKVINSLLNPGDTILCDHYTYSGTLAYLRPLQIKLAAVRGDAEGMSPEHLDRILSQPGDKKPRVLYLIPTGSNPTGVTMSNERRLDIYRVAQKHDLIILEDDPYWFLSYSKHPQKVHTSTRQLYKSFLSIDTDARVIRFDSFSKVLSAGMRLGFITAHKKWLNRFDLVTQATNLHTSSLTQMMASKLLAAYGEDGWNKHVDKVADFYGQRRDLFKTLLLRHLSGRASWKAPTAGMFFWIRLLVADSKQLIEEKARDAKVILLPGIVFNTSKETNTSSFVRASFSTASPEEMEQGIIRLAELLPPPVEKAHISRDDGKNQEKPNSGHENKKNTNTDSVSENTSAENQVNTNSGAASADIKSKL